ncbi:MAG: LysM peptidoglycan-binding domain-containing protein [Clostridia bacterium]|nr:LysM peptidoglycan-binding domain-containing protein [Clostridia bacterium]
MKNKSLKKSSNKFSMSILIIVILTLGVISLMGNKNTLSHMETSLKTIYVSSGETLWEIAEVELSNNDYYADKDIRYIIKDIKEINNLSTSNLYSGQELIIPSL